MNKQGTKRKGPLVAARRNMAKKAKVGSYVAVQKRISVPAARHQTRSPELKSVDVPYQLTHLSTTPTMNILNGIQNGAGFYNRIGNKVEMKSLEFRAQISLSDKNTTSGVDYIRFAIIYDAQPNGAYPTWADIFTSYTDQGLTSSDAFSFLNINNRERFKVFADWVFRSGFDGNVGLTAEVAEQLNTCQEATNFHRFIKLKRLVANYKSSSNPAAVGDVATGSLLFVTLGSRPDLDANYNVQWSARLRYYDT